MNMEEEDRLLRETYQLARENNKMLHAMRRSAFFSGIFRILWLAFIIGAPLWIYFTYFQPAVEQFMQAAGQAKDAASLPVGQIQNMIDTLSKFLPK